MTLDAAETILNSPNLEADCTAFELALLKLVQVMRLQLYETMTRLDDTESRIQTLIDSTGTWRDFR